MPKLRAARFFAAVVACAIAFKAHAQAPEPPSRPKVALVLSGGGARGLAHIGVLKALRDQRIPVDLIVATSMGSIVGGAYAAGHTPEELEAHVDAADWDLMFSDRPPREALSFRRKEDDRRFIGRTELGIKPEGVVLPRGAFGAQNLEEFLRVIARPAGEARTLNDLPVLFRAVATDLVTGEQVVLSDVSLPVAMRASMSIPGAFAPTEVNGRLLGDGGLVRNLPVEAARELGADVIVAVNVGTPLLPRAELSSALGVAQQMVNILTEQNVAISLASLRPHDILISPDLSGVTFIDFERGKELIARGEAAGREAASRLARLAAEPRHYALWESARTRRGVLPDVNVAAVRIEGTARTNPEALRREITDRIGIEPGKPVSEEQLASASRLLYGIGDFERVDVRSQLEQGRRVVVVDVREKPWGPNYLRVAARAVSDFHADGRFSLSFQHTHTWLNSWGAEWRGELEIGDVRRLHTSVFQPLGPGSPWFVEGVLESAKSSFDLFGSGFRRTDRITTSTTGATATFGRRIGNSGVARIGVGHERYRSRPAISSRLDPVTTRDSADIAVAAATFDTLDDPNFPRRGYLVEGVTRRHWFEGPADPVQSFSLQGVFPWTYGRLTVLGIVSAGHTRGDDRGGFGLGGFLNLSGTPAGAISGSHVLGGSALLYYRMGELPRALGRGWYAGVSAEAGNAWASRSEVSLSDVRKAASVYIGLDTVIGPMYVAWGHTFGGKSAFYLFLGPPGERRQR
jgi:NTE family protein